MKKTYNTITTVTDIRPIVSDVINMLLNDQIDNQTAQAVGSLCSLQLKIIKAEDLDKRITKLEEDDLKKTDDKTPVVSDIQAKIRELRK